MRDVCVGEDIRSQVFTCAGPTFSSISLWMRPVVLVLVPVLVVQGPQDWVISVARASYFSLAICSGRAGRALGGVGVGVCVTVCVRVCVRRACLKVCSGWGEERVRVGSTSY